jgi:hypothetical protein
MVALWRGSTGLTYARNAYQTDLDARFRQLSFEPHGTISAPTNGRAADAKRIEAPRSMSIHVHLPAQPEPRATRPALSACYRVALWQDLRARRGGRMHPLAAMARAFRRPPPL